MRPRFGSCVIERLAASGSRPGGSGNPPLRKTRLECVLASGPASSKRLASSSSDAIAPTFLPQRLAADAQDRGRARLLPCHLVQHVTDVLLLDLLQRGPAVAPRPQRRRLLQDV